VSVGLEAHRIAAHWVAYARRKFDELVGTSEAATESEGSLRVVSGPRKKSARSAHRMNDASRFERLTLRMPPALPGDAYLRERSDAIPFKGRRDPPFCCPRQVIICVCALIKNDKTCAMKTSAARSFLPIPAEDALIRLGERIGEVRRARLLTQADLASKAGVSLSTLSAIEAGAPTVQMGFYLSVLYAVDAIEGLEEVALLTKDAAAVQQLKMSLPKRVRSKS